MPIPFAPCHLHMFHTFTPVSFQFITLTQFVDLKMSLHELNSGVNIDMVQMLCQKQKKKCLKYLSSLLYHVTCTVPCTGFLT